MSTEKNNGRFEEETRRVDRFLFLLLLAHAPVAVFVVPYGYGTMHLGAAGAGAITILAAAGFLLLRGSVFLRVLNAILLMSYSALFVLCQLGRIEMHFHFFAAMAFLVLYRDWKTFPPVVLYVAGHHAVSNYCQSIGLTIGDVPFRVFSYGTGWGIVLLHALFVVFEVPILWYMAVTLHRQFMRQEETIRELDRLRESDKSSTMNQVSEAATQISSVSLSLADASSTIAENAQEQAASIEEMSASAEELTAAMDQVGDTTAAQSKTVTQLIGQMQEIEKKSAELAENISAAALTAEKTSGVARGGESSLVEMRTSMDRIAQNSSRIEEVVELIDDIADRVNLLSLNASIEAARAGEAGRGFAVVAQEISRLADQTASSTKNIADLVKTTSLSVQDGQLKMNHHINLLKSIVADVESVKGITMTAKEAVTAQVQAFQHLSGQLRNVNSVSLSVQNSTDEQRSAIRELNGVVASVNTMTQTYAQTAENLRSLARQNADLAARLREQMSAL